MIIYFSNEDDVIHSFKQFGLGHNDNDKDNFIHSFTHFGLRRLIFFIFFKIWIANKFMGGNCQSWWSSRLDVISFPYYFQLLKAWKNLRCGFYRNCETAQSNPMSCWSVFKREHATARAAGIMYNLHFIPPCLVNHLFLSVWVCVCMCSCVC